MSDLDKLIEAARLGIVEELKDLVHRHPELVRERDETGATALHYAAFGGHRDAVRLLVGAGADINATDAQFVATPSARPPGFFGPSTSPVLSPRPWSFGQCRPGRSGFSRAGRHSFR